MRQKTTIAVAMLTCLTVFSCGSNSEKKKGADKIIGQVSADKPAETMVVSEGGQPGAVVIMGQDLVSEMGPLDPKHPKKISIRTQTGFNSKMEQAPIKPGDVVPTPKLTTEAAENLLVVDADKNFINLGCDISTRSDLKGLQEKKVNPETLKEMALIRAHTVLICGISPIKAAVTSIIAKNVILNNLQHNMVGGQESFFLITARELHVTGTNLITAFGKNGTPILPFGPAVTLSAQKISGPGFVQILTSGASFQDLKLNASKESEK